MSYQVPPEIEALAREYGGHWKNPPYTWMLAISAHETGGWTSRLYLEDNNAFGIDAARLKKNLRFQGGVSGRSATFETLRACFADFTRIFAEILPQGVPLQEKLEVYCSEDPFYYTKVHNWWYRLQSLEAVPPQPGKALVESQRKNSMTPLYRAILTKLLSYLLGDLWKRLRQVIVEEIFAAEGDPNAAGSAKKEAVVSKVKNWIKEKVPELPFGLEDDVEEWLCDQVDELVAYFNGLGKDTFASLVAGMPPR